MYFRLQQLQKASFSDYDKSITFLTGLAGSDYSDQVNTLITTVENYNMDTQWPDVGESGLLPEHLRIPALATRLNQFAQRRISQSLVPYVNRLHFADPYPETLHTLPSPTAYRVDNAPTRDHSNSGRSNAGSDSQSRDRPQSRTPGRTRLTQPPRKSLPNPRSARRPFVNTNALRAAELAT